MLFKLLEIALGALEHAADAAREDLKEHQGADRVLPWKHLGHFTEGGRFQELWSQGRFVRGLTEFGFHIGYAAVWSGALVPYSVLRGLGRKEEK